MRRWMIIVLLSGILLTSCANDLPASLPQEQDAAVQPTVERVWEGSGNFTGENVDTISAEQQQLILDYMDCYYDSLAGLNLLDMSDLFAENAAVFLTLNQEVLNFQIEVRAMQKGDLSLVGYQYELVVSAVREVQDGELMVVVKENSVQNFAQHPEVDSQLFNVNHYFTLTLTDIGWKISRHFQSDRLYTILPGGFRQLMGATSDDDLIQRIRTNATQMLEEARENVEMRSTQGAEAAVSYDYAYDRAAAVAYANRWVPQRNTAWADYTNYGGNCQNFVSQCLLEGGIPMDTTGTAVWKWYGETPNNLPQQTGRSASWSAVDDFLNYAEENTGYGLVAVVDAPYASGEVGDVITMGFDEEWRHTVIITGIVTDDEGNVVDYLIHSNTADQANFPLRAYAYTRQILTKIYGWND